MPFQRRNRGWDADRRPKPRLKEMTIALSAILFEMCLTYISIYALLEMARTIVPGGKAHALLGRLDPYTRFYKELACWAGLLLVTFVVLTYTWTLVVHLVPAFLFMNPAHVGRSRALIQLHLLALSLAKNMIDAAFRSRSRNRSVRELNICFVALGYIFVARFYTWFWYHLFIKGIMEVVLVDIPDFIVRYAQFLLRIFELAINVNRRLSRACPFKYYVQVKI